MHEEKVPTGGRRVRIEGAEWVHEAGLEWRLPGAQLRRRPQWAEPHPSLQLRNDKEVLTTKGASK